MGGKPNTRRSSKEYCLKLKILSNNLINKKFVLILFLIFLTFSLNSNALTKANSFDELANQGITYIKVDNNGLENSKGANHVIIFNPKSIQLDFKVNVGLFHDIYETDTSGNFLKEYQGKKFNTLITEDNSLLDGKKPFAAINADYIDTNNTPQGLNVSRGVEYSGSFSQQRSSFGVGSNGTATIDIGYRGSDVLNYNVAGGNGRFYTEGVFNDDACTNLGTRACLFFKSRSIVAITEDNYVILLTNDQLGPNALTLKNSKLGRVISDIAYRYDLGKIKEGMFFDQGRSVSMMYNGESLTNEGGNLGSVFLIYRN